MGFQSPTPSPGSPSTITAPAIPQDKLGEALDNRRRADLVHRERTPTKAALLADPGVAALRATTQNRNVFTGKDPAGAIAFASPLSYPVVADQLRP